MSVVIERATAADAPSILRIRRAAEDWLALRGIEQWPPGAVPLDRVRAQIERREWFVARDGGPPCGAFRLLWEDPLVWPEDGVRAAYVHGLVIDRRFAGSGLGAAMLAWAEDRARAEGASALRLDCVAHNMALRRYYAGRGFQEVGISGARSSALFERRLDRSPAGSSVDSHNR